MIRSAEILFANDAFYQVFRSRDIGAMERLWARRLPVVCVHPGWRALMDREAVMESWRGILSNPEAPAIACRAARAQVIGELGLVVCYEIIGADVLVATNAFAREGGACRMVLHQAGPCGVPPRDIEEEPPPEPLQ